MSVYMYSCTVHCWWVVC